MRSGMVWLMLIPAFNLLWHFVIVLNMSKSLRNEYSARGFALTERDPGQNIGLAMCICVLTGFVPFVGPVLHAAGIVCWILYWVKIAGYSRKLAEAAA